MTSVRENSITSRWLQNTSEVKSIKKKKKKEKREPRSETYDGKVTSQEKFIYEDQVTFK